MKTAFTSKKMAVSPDGLAFERIARLFGVLAEPTRLKLLFALHEGEATVSALVARLAGAKQANVSKQLGVLYDAGLLSRARAGNQIIYAVREPAIFELCEIVCGKLQRDAQADAKLFGVS